MTQQSDLGLLRTALVLLDEQHVTRAAARLHLSISATSRALDRCRQTFRDPLLVAQGRNVVITPRGEELREQIRPLLADIDALLAPPLAFEPHRLRATFPIRANEAVIAGGGGQILALASKEAPHAQIRFDIEAADDIEALRSGAAALAIGSYSSLPDDISTEHLLTEHLVGVVRADHPALQQKITVRRFAALTHLVVSRRGIARGPIDAELATHGLTRAVAAVVPSFAAALAMAAQSDYVTVAPSGLADVFSKGAGLRVFTIPVPIPSVDVRQIWHHRLTNDPLHAWLRSCVSRASLAGPSKPTRTTTHTATHTAVTT
jgi:DNA-binding transcriptional LysR family regulator